MSRLKTINEKLHYTRLKQHKMAHLEFAFLLDIPTGYQHLAACYYLATQGYGASLCLA